MDVSAILRASQSPRHGLLIEQPYTVHGRTVERIRFDGKLVGHRLDGELVACNMRHQVWLEQQVESSQSSQSFQSPHHQASQSPHHQGGK